MAPWLVFTINDEVLMKRDEQRTKWFIVLIEFGKYIQGLDCLCSQKTELKVRKNFRAKVTM